MQTNPKFRFPISRSFSITGQPISRLISGNVPESYTERTELFEAVLEKYESIRDGHEQARSMALASQSGGRSFALYLRNFTAEEFSYSEDPVERAYDLRLAQFEKMVRQQVERAGSAMLSLRGGSDQLDEFLGRGEPIFTGQFENWRDLAAELIAAAKVIIIFATDITPGLLQEVEIIRASRKTDRTMVFLASPSRSLRDIFKHDPDPVALANLKARFSHFENVHEAPRLPGWQPSLLESAADLPDWPGATRLRELLRDGYAGVSELRAVQVAPFRILAPTELQSADHQAAKQYLEQALELMRKGLRGLDLRAPMEQSGLGDQPDSNHLGLRLAHQAFGIGAALEDYAAMLESLSAISVVYTYVLANPTAGLTHVEHAFRLFRLRDFEGVRYQDLPELKRGISDFVREQIGNVYYALARIRRAQGEADAARVAFEASLAVREPLQSMSARQGVAATLHSLGGLLHAMGEDAEARRFIERAIAMKEALYGKGANEEVAASLHNLGSILIKMGDLEGADAAIKRSFEMKKAVFGTIRHVSVAETALLAGWLLIELGARNEAVPVLQFAQSVFRELAPGSPQLAKIDAILAD